MRVLLQRSLASNVQVEGTTVGQIGHGMVILVGFTEGDTEKTIDEMVHKVLNVRIFDDENNVMNRSILDIPDSQILSISQFTLYASLKKGHRPSYSEALAFDKAKILYDLWNQKLREQIPTETGIFGENMQVSITNDGPVTLWLESR